jgi:hypothetical protein
VVITTTILPASQGSRVDHLQAPAGLLIEAVQQLGIIAAEPAVQEAVAAAAEALL